MFVKSFTPFVQDILENMMRSEKPYTKSETATLRKQDLK